ncbi:ABC transporter substrate-binding protein [Roseibium denhamense]|uniref:Microcin C transport system substrate-binding protein n=1 Tax=Roseibium denhamense TaxID=76305 RepID=A0ABY1PLH2_9HYPH|nr:extracellular solute-binding protein [Roseibium denhamense]MTI06912.1 ABC transporter substrate-binding protein [Roseibium denhamense]SMP36777.1 microcin C transport system substrate-binding protein [Roseibium denhamense]
MMSIWSAKQTKTWRGVWVALALATGLTAAPVLADEPEWHHASSLTDSPRYAADVKHFNYVNPDAPKGGTVRVSDIGGFDTFNPLLPKGSVAPGIGLIYDTLMEQALDEDDISGQYGLIAEAVRYPDDYSWVEYRLNPAARWHDGKSITPEDVIWSFEKATELSPRQRFYYQNVTSATSPSEGIVRFEFDAANNRELPHIVGQILVLPKHWWTGTDADGQQRDIGRSLIEAPMGSGPYKIKSFEPNRFVVYERVEDYWAQDLPVRTGTNNFDEIRYDSYLDQTVLLEAFKGDQYDWRSENIAKNWATGYEIPAVEDGKIVLETFADRGRGIMQAFVPNLRLEKFQDERVRRALNLAFDFESINRTAFFDQYKRTASYFAGTELAHSGLPEGEELEILESVRDLIPAEVFTQEYQNPVGGSRDALRSNLRQAVGLFREAGYQLEDGTMVHAETREPFTIEFVDNNPNSVRYVQPYADELAKLGIEMTIRVLDTPQYINRIRSRDFEMSTLAWAQSLSPGNEQRDYWGSVAADQEQSFNYAGIKDPGIDALIDKVIFADDRETLIAATRALDRVLMHNNYVIPQWHSGIFRTARWNRFSHPETMPEYTHGFPTIWWYDTEKAEKTGAAR